MNEQRNQSKSKRPKYTYETRAQRAERIHATKVNAKRRKIKLKYAKPIETPEREAKRAEDAKEAARKVFDNWLQKNYVTEFAKKHQKHYGLVYWVRQALEDALPKEEK
jgi:hypothetical protein